MTIIVPRLTVYTKAAAHTYMENLSHSNHKNFNAYIGRKMAQAAGNKFANMMDSDQSFETILIIFGITQRATNRLTEDYVTANDLMASSVEQIKYVVNIQNKMYRSHATALHCCYINTAQLNSILAFYNWTVYAIKDAHAE